MRRSWLFRFDWFLKTRTAQELSRRVDTLARAIEKEIAELEAAEVEAERSRKKAGKQPAAKAGAKRPPEQEQAPGRKRQK